MKSIEYKGKERLKAEYRNCLKQWALDNKQIWKDLRQEFRFLSAFPADLSHILVGEFEDLARWFSCYRVIECHCHDELSKIFHYNGKNQSIIAEFFKEHSYDLNINSCNYCDMAYVNTYQYRNKNYSHFDLDHFFPKKKCPILALSLFNLIPSCPTCNQRLKRGAVLGSNVEEYLLLSPSSDKYAFQESVTIHLVPTEFFFNLQFQINDNPGMFKIKFVTKSNGYKKAIDLFRLEERYAFHKPEAIRLLKLKQKYPDSNIEMISHLIKRSRSEIKEDLFCNKSMNGRILSQLHRDILHYKEDYLSASQK